MKGLLTVLLVAGLVGCTAQPVPPSGSVGGDLAARYARHQQPLQTQGEEGRPCDGERQALCQAWAQARAPRGTAHSACRLEGHPTCWIGDDGCDQASASWPTPPCLCAGRQCRVTEVCISDTPESPKRCVEAVVD